MNRGIIGVAALALIGTAASAGPVRVTSGPVPAAHVSVGDLNLDRPEDRALLKQRIRAAAESLCAVEQDETANALPGSRGCYEAAVAEGLRQMQSIGGQRVASGSGRH